MARMVVLRVISVILSIVVLSCTLHAPVQSQYADVARYISFLGEDILLRDWEAISAHVHSWASRGQWEFQPNRTIIDDASIYTPCKMKIYGIHNPCAWVLDGNVLKYDWNIISAHHKLLPFSSKGLCDMVAPSGNIMIVGDSTSGLYEESLANEFLHSAQQGCTEPVDSVRVLPTCNLTISLGRNDHLTLTNISIGLNMEKNVVYDAWINKLIPNNVGLLILNRGAHYVEDSEFLEGVNNTLSYLATNHPNISIIWRNTYAGLPSYAHHAFSPPLTKIEEVDAKWHYEEFAHQNMLVHK